MNRANTNRAGWLERLLYFLLGTLIYSCLTWQVMTLAASGDSEPAWSSPSIAAIRKVSDTPSTQTRPLFLSNMDCGLVSFRYVGSSTMQTGCFTDSAFGMMDSDGGSVIFNDTDEALPLLAYSPHQVLAPWPKSMELVVLDSLNGGGARVSLYRNPLTASKDNRDLLLRLVSKQLIQPPDLPLTDKLDQPLSINAQTLTFSDNGSWMVAETLNGSFVRVNLATLGVKPFAPSFVTSGGPSLLKSYVAVTDNGRYVAIANNYSSVLRVYDLANCGPETPNLEPQNCPMHDYWPFAGQQITGLTSISHVRFINDGLLSFEAVTAGSTHDGVYELAPAASINSLIDYLGLGDSFTSGEGAFDYLAGTDTTSNSCHLSSRSYPFLLTHDIFTAHGGHSVACSGAKIYDVASQAQDYKGQVGQEAAADSVLTNFLPGYIAQQRFIKQYQPATTTVSVGGNDVGFGNILESCVVPHLSRQTSDNVCFDTYESRQELVQLIDRTVPRWTRLYNQLQAEAPLSRIYVIGYPSIASDTGKCGLNVHLNTSEIEFSEEIIAYLNDAVQKAAHNAGLTYVDISQALYGHRLCESASYNLAVNGLTAGKDSGPLGLKVFGNESYHPNALGHQLIEQAILRQTHNLTVVAATPDTANDGHTLLTGPKTGRAVTKRSPESQLTPRVALKDQPTAVNTHQNDDLKPLNPYQVRLDGPTGTIIGSAPTDENGNLATTVVIPGDTASGGHSLDVIGTDQVDEPIDVTQPIYVPQNNDDADGDGIPNDSDSCPAAVNSGVDDDQDGIDDTCDGSIGSPPVGGNPSGLSSGSIVTDTTNPVKQFQITSNGATAPNVLGTATSNPFGLPAKKISQSAPAGNSGVKTPRRIHINWLPWLVLALLIWLLLIVLGMIIDRYVDKKTRYVLA